MEPTHLGQAWIGGRLDFDAELRLRQRGRNAAGLVHQPVPALGVIGVDLATGMVMGTNRMPVGVRAVTGGHGGMFDGVQFAYRSENRPDQHAEHQ